MNKKDMLLELKQDYKSEKSYKEKLATAFLIVIYTIQTNRIVRLLCDFVSSLLALVLVVSVTHILDLFAGLGAYVIFSLIWSYIRGDEDNGYISPKTSTVLLLICLIISYCIGCTYGEIAFLAAYFFSNLQITVLKELCHFL